MDKNITISTRTILLVFGLVISLWLASQLLDIFLMLFIASILVSALNPTVDRLEHRRISRPIAILILYFFVVLGIIVTLAIVVPGLVDQTKILIETLPQALSNIDFFTNHQQELSAQILSRVGALPENLLKISISFFGNLLDTITTLVISFYMLLYRPKLKVLLSYFLSGSQLTKAEKTWEHIEHRLGDWVRGELLLMLSIGLMTYVGLSLLRIEIALPLAILAGLLEIVPNIGPLISAVPAVVIAFSLDPVKGVSTICLYILVQFAENHFLVPNIMRKAVGVNPLLSILALMIGFRLAGPVGAILSIPSIILIETIFTNYLQVFRPVKSVVPGDE